MVQGCVHCGQAHPSFALVCPATGMRIGTSLTVVSDDLLLVGGVVHDRWHVKEVLGQGTTGTVFIADHIGVGRSAALKVLRPRYATADVLHRVFHGEARAAWTVSHPCLVEVLDVGTLPDGAPFFVAERLEGETLAARLERERLSTAAAVDVVMQILSAIDAIHARDLVLRDLRPHNVFLAHRRGCRPLVKILDFGLARLVPLEGVREEWDALRASVPDGAEAGALSIPYYLSPERTRGEHAVERASDLFVATILFYESLTAQHPFGARTFDALLQAVAQAEVPRLSDLRPDVPPELDALVSRALAANPRARPATARDLQEEIRAVFDGPVRRPSTSLRAVQVALPPPPAPLPPAPRSSVDSAVHTPLREPSRTAAYVSTDLVGDETMDEVTRNGRREALLAGDEASAESPHRTGRPQATIDIVVDEQPLVHDDPATSRGQDFDAAMKALQGDGREDEETETMQLTTELRQRIEAMTRAKAVPPAPLSTAESSRPPPTRRLR